jgi:hypothetical protein
VKSIPRQEIVEQLEADAASHDFGHVRKIYEAAAKIVRDAPLAESAPAQGEGQAGDHAAPARGEGAA